MGTKVEEWVLQFIKSTMERLPDGDTLLPGSYIYNILGRQLHYRELSYNPDYQNITFRCRTSRGQESELTRFRDGYADWSLQVWKRGKRIVGWILVDLNIIRAWGLLEIDRRVIVNERDGSKFVSVTIKELDKHECIINAKYPWT